MGRDVPGPTTMQKTLRGQAIVPAIHDSTTSAETKDHLPHSTAEHQMRKVSKWNYTQDSMHRIHKTQAIRNLWSTLKATDYYTEETPASIIL